MAQQRTANLLWEFLVDSIKGREPKREKARALKLVELLNETDNREEVVSSVAQRLKKNYSPEKWCKSVELLAIYLDGPHASNLAPLLTLKILRNASPSERIEFFLSIDDWFVLKALCAILPNLTLLPAELIRMIEHLDQFTANDMGRGVYINSLRAWANRNETASQVVSQWLDIGFPEQSISAASIQALIEGVVGSLEGPQGLAYRDKLISDLFARGNLERWNLAVRLVMSAWPAPRPSADERFQRLLSEVERFPELLFSSAILETRREARTAPIPAVSAAVKLFRLLQNGSKGIISPSEFSVSAVVTDLLFEAACGTSQDDMEKLVDASKILFSISLDTRPSHAQHTFSMLVDEMAKWNETFAREFVAHWIRRHAQEIINEGMSFSDLLPLVAHQRFQSIGSWIVSYLTHNDYAIRTVAVVFLMRNQDLRSKFILGDEHFSSIGPTLAKGIALELIGVGASAKATVPILLSLIRCYPMIREFVVAILLEYIAEDYPEYCSDLVENWEKSPHVKSVSEEVKNALKKRITERFEGNERKKMVPEIFDSSPARSVWYRITNQVQQEATRAERRSGKYLIDSIASTIHVDRGEKWASINQESPYVDFQTSYEIPRREVLDPVMSKVFRQELRDKASAIFGGGGSDA